MNFFFLEGGKKVSSFSTRAKNVGEVETKEMWPFPRSSPSHSHRLCPHPDQLSEQLTTRHTLSQHLILHSIWKVQ